MTPMCTLSKWRNGLQAVPFKHVNCVDFEYDAGRGNVPDPVCMVVIEMRSGTIRRYWRDELQKLKCAPFETGDDAVMVAYAAQAELGCFYSLGWPLPVHVLDLFAEFRVATNGALRSASLLNALAFHNLPLAVLWAEGREQILRYDKTISSRLWSNRILC